MEKSVQTVVSRVAADGVALGDIVGCVDRTISSAANFVGCGIHDLVSVLWYMSDTQSATILGHPLEDALKRTLIFP